MKRIFMILNFHMKDPGKDAALGNFLWTSGLYHPAFIHDKDQVAVMQRLRKIVKHQDDSPAFLLQRCEKIEEEQLVFDVHIGRRLVEKQNGCILHQLHGEKYPLTFAAGEGGKRFIAEISEVHQINDTVNGLAVCQTELSGMP